MADTVKFNLKTWRKWLGDVSFEKAARKGLLSGAQRALPVLHRATDNAPPASPNGQRGANNTGRYRRSWKAQRIDRGVAIFNDAPYAPIIEKGRRKGIMPPPKALVGWVQKRAGVSKADAQSAAYAIALAIKKRGLKPRHVLKDSMAELRKMVIQEVEHELRLELNTR